MKTHEEMQKYMDEIIVNDSYEICTYCRDRARGFSCCGENHFEMGHEVMINGKVDFMSDSDFDEMALDIYRKKMEAIEKQQTKGNN